MPSDEPEDMQAADIKKKAAQIEKVESDLRKTMGKSDKPKTIDTVDRKRTLGDILQDQAGVLQAIIGKKSEEDDRAHADDEGVEDDENREDETDDDAEGGLENLVGKGHTGG